MTTEEFINYGNTLQSLQFSLFDNENVNMWLFYRNEKNKGHLMDISLFFYNNNTTIEYKYKFYQIDSLSKAKAKLEDIYKVIQTLS